MAYTMTLTREKTYELLELTLSNGARPVIVLEDTEDVAHELFVELLFSDRKDTVIFDYSDFIMNEAFSIDKINELADRHYGLTLSISLHATNNTARSEIMPVNKTYPIETLIDACRKYIDKTGRRISFEYAVIEGVNDGRDSADELIRLLRGINCHVNLIPVNQIKERDYKSNKNSVRNFQLALEKGGLNATVRRTLGSDINAACGQLRREYEI